MCLILFAYRVHPRYELVLAANRDEFYARPTAPMAYWEAFPEVLAGRDLQAGGTWLGISRSGRFAAVTNYRDPTAVKPQAPSRGALVGNFLTGRTPAAEYLMALSSSAHKYNGFNLLMRDAQGFYYYSNRNGAPRQLEPGIYGLSNHLLDTPWVKVEKGRATLTELLTEGREVIATELINMLHDAAIPPDAQLPDTGVGLALERRLASMFIQGEEYGTRSSTALLWPYEGAVTCVEKTWDDNSLREFIIAVSE